MEHSAHDPVAPEMAQLLLELGYGTAFRESGWHECLLSGHGEAWLGRGPSRRAAWEHALAQALPSRAAQELWRRACQRPSPRTAEAAEPAGPARTGGDVLAGLDARADAPPAAAAPAAVDAAPAPAAPPRPEPEPRPEVVLRPHERRAPSRTPLPELLARYDAIAEAMDAAREEGGLLEPERQRLLLLSWIAEARGLEAQSGGHREAHERTYRIAQRCSRLARIWWPGSVRALAIEADPRDCAGDLPADPPLELASWGAVAEAAEAALEARETAAGEQADEHGWRDGDALALRCSQPDALLREIVAVLEKVSGPILRPRDEGERTPGFAPGVEPERLDVAPWLVLAKKLRWLRGGTSDLELWGAAMGRLRWLATRLPRARAEALWRILDPAYRPAQTWAKDLGHDPDKRRRQRERKELVSAPPEPGWGEERLRTWILRTIELGPEMPTERMASLLEPVAEDVLRIDVPTFSERRGQRVRLEAVRRMLRKEPPPAAEAAPAVPLEEDIEPAGPTFQERLVELVHPHTRGRSALFVSNRNDPTIDEQVKALFGFEVVDHCEIKPATIAAKAHSIEQGGYDFVLAATGFLPHKVDGLLKAAAKRASVPYVSVNRGRPLSCALHLARELGLQLPPA